MADLPLRYRYKGNKIFMYLYAENSWGEPPGSKTVVASTAVRRGRFSTAFARATDRS